MIFYDYEIKPDWNKRNKMLLRVSADTTFDRMVSIIINGIGLDSGHLYEFTVVTDGTTRKQQLERGSKVIDEGADIPLPNLWQYPNPQEYDRAAKRIVKETHFTYEPLSVIKWKTGMKMWLLYDFGDMDYFIITCTNVTTGGEYATGRAIRKKTAEDLHWLREQRLGIIYLGVESGDPKTLVYVNKDTTAEQLIEAGQKVKAAGISLSVTVLLGIAPTGHSLAHSQHTGQLLTAMNPDYVGAL